MKRNRLLLGVAFALSLAVGGHALFWQRAEQRLRAGVDAWVAERRAAGWRVQAAEPVAAGWPLAARLILKDMSVEGAGDEIPDGFSWRAERVTVGVALLHPRVLFVVPAEEQHLRLGRLPDLGYTADRLRIEIPLDPAAQADVADLTGEMLRVGFPVGRQTATLTVGLLRVRTEFHPDARAGQPALATTASAEAVALPPPLHSALGGRLSAVSLDGVVSGPVPPPLPLTERALAWRDGGGTVDIPHVAFGWGPLGVTGNAKLLLDGNLQPIGTGTAQMVGYVEAVDALARGGAISSGAAVAIKAVAALIASTPEGSGPSEVELPLTLRDRTLSARQIPLARLPTLAWPPT